MGGNSAAGSEMIHSVGRWGGSEADWMGGCLDSHGVDWSDADHSRSIEISHQCNESVTIGINILTNSTGCAVGVAVG